MTLLKQRTAASPSGRPVRRTRRRRRLLVVLALFLVLALVPGVSLLRAVTAPGTDSSAAKAAEWARGHHLGFAVTAAEELIYRLHPPRSGGSPDTSLLAPEAGAPAAAAGSSRGSQRATPLPAMQPLVSPGLAGEGKFRIVVSSHGHAAVQLAYLRPDAVHTSYLSAVMVMDPSVTRFVQHPGYAEPGHLNLWSQPDHVARGDQQNLVATFNSGFKLQDSRGGYYADGHTLGQLRSGAASMVITKNGKLDVGTWGTDFHMSKNIVSVRQNLRLLVADGQPVPSVEGNAQSTWGTTVKGADFVWRSGVGVTKSGKVVYVVGDALSAKTLAHVMQRAGVQRGMELDINQTWVAGMWYDTGKSGNRVAHKVLPFQRPANRYFESTSRDFIAVHSR